MGSNPTESGYCFFGGIGLRVWLKIKLSILCLVYIGDWRNGSAQDFDSWSVGVRLPYPQPILPLSLIGKTPASDSGFRGSSPRGAAKSRSIMDGTIYQSLKKVGRRIRSVHRLKSGAMRTADLRCNNTLLRFAVNRKQNRFYKKFDFLKNLWYNI